MSSAKSAFYAVRKGRKPGVYTNWSECESQVKGFPAPKFKKFLTEDEAWTFVRGNDMGCAAASSCASTASKNTKSCEKVATETATAAVDDTVESTSQPAANKTEPASVQKKVKAGQKRTTKLLPDDFHTNLESKRSKDGPVSVYTDGCCFNNGKDNPCGGIGVYWGPGNPNNLSERLSGRQTNNRAEIYAAMRAIQQAKAQGLTELQIYTDSIFLVNCQTKWVKKWKTNGWQSSAGKEVLNREELELLDAESNGITVTYVHVPGHSGLEGNEAADKLANEGARKKIEQV